MTATKLTAHVTHTTVPDGWNGEIHRYRVVLSNGIVVNRQASKGAQGVAFHLDYPRKTTASKDIRRLSKFKKEPGYVIVNLETEEVIICG